MVGQQSEAFNFVGGQRPPNFVTILRRVVTVEKVKKKTKKAEVKTPKIRKQYLVAVCITAFRQNFQVKVRANNDYCALLETMRKIRSIVSEMYQHKADMIEDNWKEEEKELCARFRDYDSLKSYLCIAGFIVSTPYQLTE